MKKLFVFLSLLSTAAIVSAEYYTEPQIYQMRPRVDREMTLDCIGATGIKARIYPGVLLKVEGVIKGAPAEGKFKVGEILTGINGTELKGLNPFVVLGKALTAAEATDGKMVFDVKKDEKAKARKVTVKIPVMGEYSKTWPLKCEKSKKIIAAAAEYYAKDSGFREKFFGDKSENGGMPSALACLFLLSTGDDQYVPVVKEYFAGFPKDLEKIGDHTWNNGYNGIACAEYYLRTGDRDVLPILQYYCDNAAERQCFGCGWQHWGKSISPRYVAGGLMNPAGCQVLTTLLLAKECGSDVNEATLQGALKFWYRFAGHGTVPYGDHRSEGGLSSNGKDGMSAAAMTIAACASGNTKNYEQAAKHLSMATLTSYPGMIRGHGDAGRGDGIWRGIASAYALDFDRKAYHTAMNRIQWWYDLSRRPSGALGMAACQRFDDVGSGAGTAMAYTAPLKTLQITGAPRSKYAKDFELPVQPWGNKADLEFLSIKPGRKHGKEEPIHVSYYKLGNAYSSGDPDALSFDEVMKNVYHKRYVMRAQACKVLRARGKFDVLERLLGDRDPRVRRAALDGMADYRYWFHIGKNPMKPEQFTPGLVDAVVKILKNRKEAIYVIDGALMVMSLMPPETIGENLSLVMPWTLHEEWWLRQSSFRALAQAAGNEEILPDVLPRMLEMFMKEDHTMPREWMMRDMKALLKNHGTDSVIGQQILATHMQVAKNRQIMPGQRAGEGEYDVGLSVDVILKEDPSRALDLARAMKMRFDDLSTAGIISQANGFRNLIEKLPSDQVEPMKKLLHSDYRAELIGRMKKEGSNLSLVDTILAMTELQKGGAGWDVIGSPKSEERVWHFTSFEPEGDDVLHHREKKRFRDVELPEGMDKWYEPGFDDSKWSEGKAPIGKGGFEKRKVSFESKSTWGDGEFLMMRTTFNVDKLDYDYYRISVLANQGFDIYLNGKKIHTYIWWKDDPYYRKIMLGEDHIKLLKKGINHLAVRAGSDYVTGKQVGQIDMCLEGLREKDLLGE